MSAIIRLVPADLRAGSRGGGPLCSQSWWLFDRGPACARVGSGRNACSGAVSRQFDIHNHSPLTIMPVAEATAVYKEDGAPPVAADERQAEVVLDERARSKCSRPHASDVSLMRKNAGRVQCRVDDGSAERGIVARAPTANGRSASSSITNERRMKQGRPLPTAQDIECRSFAVASCMSVRKLFPNQLTLVAASFSAGVIASALTSASSISSSRASPRSSMASA